jgi:hypothetical protein
MLPYTLKLAGVPTLSAFEPGVLRPGDPRTAGRIVLAVAAPVEKALHEMRAATLARRVGNGGAGLRARARRRHRG